MTKLILGFFIALFPVLGLAAGDSLSFTPPVTDYSVIFLGNIFGVVDGVLHGTGSQVLGQMFAVFNAAVLALGGIIIIYTLLVSTLNTANEGQMLGKKWDSMWVPVRATLGLALLIPKASGYCVMQIFVMWIIVQGVGAADKVWNAALSYLNRGGVIMPVVSESYADFMNANSDIARGAAAILQGQTCMLGLQKILTTQRQSYINLAEKDSGGCSGEPSPELKQVCDNPVPNFIASVNAITAQSDNPGPGPYSVPMPNFTADPYKQLNGICGTIQWNAIPTSTTYQGSLTSSETNTVNMSRAIAVQQLYLDLSAIAEAAVNNDPALNPSGLNDQFGIPYLSSTQPCANGDTSQNCVAQSWNKDPALTTTLLYTGYEYIQAISDYNSVMQPTLNLMMSEYNPNYNAARQFITNAESQGWIMAGSYFYNLAQLNALVNQGTGSVKQYDANSGLNNSAYLGGQLTSLMQPDGTCSSYKPLCVWLDGNNTGLQAITALAGTNQDPIGQALPVQIPTVVQGPESATIVGYLNNAAFMTLPGQPGIQGPDFAVNTPYFPALNWQLPRKNFDCKPNGPYNKIGVWPLNFCSGDLGELFYNDIFLFFMNKYIGLTLLAVKWVMNIYIFLPLGAFAYLLKGAVKFIQQPNVNPIIGLANMGIFFINFGTNLAVLLTVVIAILMSIPIVDAIVGMILIIVLPLLLTWFAILFTIGFMCAYYIPFIPYIVFTFGSIGWLMAVIEAMVAAPIIALGVTHPEGEGPFGKGEQALMILMNVFLRPSMMIIGYIAAILLSYVAIWVLNAGFAQISMFITGDPNSTVNSVIATPGNQTTILSKQGYRSWAGLYGFFFVIFAYVTIYIIIVQRTFTLITILPDKVLRWVSGGQQESYGSDTAQWGDEAKQKIEKSAEETGTTAIQTSKNVAAKGIKKANELRPKGGKSSYTGGE